LIDRPLKRRPTRYADGVAQALRASWRLSHGRSAVAIATAPPSIIVGSYRRGDGLPAAGFARATGTRGVGGCKKDVKVEKLSINQTIFIYNLLHRYRYFMDFNTVIILCLLGGDE
jgi:hypothetical protein